MLWRVYTTRLKRETLCRGLPEKHGGWWQHDVAVQGYDRRQFSLHGRVHYMEEDERSEYGSFASADEALDACRTLVEDALLAQYKDGATADQLFERYTSFGSNPFVVAPIGEPKVEFSAWAFAQRRAAELTAPR
jgi:hypothetical protein